MASKTSKENNKRFDFSKTVDTVKTSAKDMNEFVLETSEEVIDATLKSAEQWQNVGEKAIKGGLKLAANQQEVLFDTLDSIKSQLKESRSRVKDLFSRN